MHVLSSSQWSLGMKTSTSRKALSQGVFKVDKDVIARAEHNGVETEEAETTVVAWACDGLVAGGRGAESGCSNKTEDLPAMNCTGLAH